MSRIDPLLPPSFLCSRRSPRSALDRLRFYEATVRRLTLPASTKPGAIQSE